MTDGATGGARPELIVGRYRVVGAGAVGPATVTLEGYDERLARPVALEGLRPEWSGYPALRAAFAAAAYRSARIQHHQVLRTFDVASDDGTVYIVTDLATGGTLADRLAGGPQTDASVRRLGLAVLAGLDAAHRAGVLHLDLTPANVVFDEHGTVQVARFAILDALYGAARGQGGSEPEVSAGADRMVLPAPLARRAPECVAGAEPTAATDFWSVGALLYRALTGSFPPRPSMGAGPGSAPLSAVRPGTDRRLVAAVERALDPRPERRFASVAEMAQALAPSSHPVPGGPSPGYVTAATSATAATRRATSAAAATRRAGGTVPAGIEVRTARHRALTRRRSLAARPGRMTEWGSRRTRVMGVLGAGAAAAVAGAILIPALLRPVGGAPVQGNTPAGVSPSAAGAGSSSTTSAPTSTVPTTPAPAETVAAAPPATAAVPATTTTVPATTTTSAPAATATTVPATTTTSAPAATATTVPATTTSGG